MINVTEIAAKQINKKLEEREKGLGIKIGIRTSGCNGFAYTLEYADNVPDGCDLFESESISVIVDRKHGPYLHGLIVDFTKDGLNEGFSYTNPNQKGSCGCGESFNI
jgi:iron-sulfur cluster assembly protein